MPDRYYAIRQARTKVIGSRSMTEAEAAREVAAWAAGIGPARVVAKTPAVARAVRTYDQAALTALLTEKETTA